MSYGDDTRAALVQLFGSTVSENEDTMAECLSLVRLYDLTAQDLYYKFEAYALSSLPAAARTSPTIADFRALRQHLQAASASAMAAEALTPMKRDPFQYPGGHYSAARAGSSRKMMGLGGLMGSSTRTNSCGQQTPSRTFAVTKGTDTRAHAVGDESMKLDDSPSHSQRFRPDAEHRPWKVLQTLNGKVSTSASPSYPASSGGSRVALAVGADPRKWQYRYMFERGGERGEGEPSLHETCSIM